MVSDLLRRDLSRGWRRRSIGGRGLGDRVGRRRVRRLRLSRLRGYGRGGGFRDGWWRRIRARLGGWALSFGFRRRRRGWRRCRRACSFLDDFLRRAGFENGRLRIAGLYSKNLLKSRHSKEGEPGEQ